MKSALVILATVLMFVATPAFANCDNINVSGISDAAEAELKLACQQALVDASATLGLPAGLDRRATGHERRATIYYQHLTKQERLYYVIKSVFDCSATFLHRIYVQCENHTSFEKL